MEHDDYVSANIRELRRMDACQEAVEWLENHAAEGGDWESAWTQCPRGDWLLWLLGRMSATDHKVLVSVACDCAEIALPYATGLEAATAIAIARAWTSGEASPDEVRDAASAANAAASATVYADSAAAYAASAAAYAAGAAYVDCAANAASAANAAANAASAACADIVRKYFPDAPEL